MALDISSHSIAIGARIKNGAIGDYKIACHIPVGRWCDASSIADNNMVECRWCARNRHSATASKSDRTGAGESGACQLNILCRSWYEVHTATAGHRTVIGKRSCYGMCRTTAIKCGATTNVKCDEYYPVNTGIDTTCIIYIKSGICGRTGGI